MADIYEPQSEAEAALIIADAANAQNPLAIFGGNTRSGFGNIVSPSLKGKKGEGIEAGNRTGARDLEPLLPLGRSAGHREAMRGSSGEAFGGNPSSALRAPSPQGEEGGDRAESAPFTTRKLKGITAYNPAEMTMTALAGTPMAEIEAELADNNQMMAFEPADHRMMMGTEGVPTIGGLFATNTSGPRRFVAGAARDSLLGVRFINGSGEVIKSGGRVMKNVTGLDLVKLLAGSYGTLGVLTEVTFKVLPAPRAETTIVISGLNDAEAALAMSSAMATSAEVSGAAHLPESVRWLFGKNGLPDGPATLLRIEGLPASVEDRAVRLAGFMQTHGAVHRLDASDSQQIWREIRDVTPFSDNGSKKPLWRISCAPTAGHQLLAALRLETGVNAFFDWQGGLLWMQMEGDAEADLIRSYLKRLGGGHATLLRAKPHIRANIAAFEPQEPGVAALSQAVRLKLDPNEIFNPGRMG